MHVTSQLEIEMNTETEEHAIYQQVYIYHDKAHSITLTKRLHISQLTEPTMRVQKPIWVHPRIEKYGF